ncbi:class I SAM-dependent methyltransferase [Streptomyces sp. NPDC046860]|uniref:class I SAM-dependent methyltransferase n=1 Tax=Streptomyces sp. NPDC046860 TaxID=3154495 RepID=UPI0033DB4F12
MAAHPFNDLSLAAHYDALNPWGPGDDFHLGLIRTARSVLDIGCGTGQLLRRARAEGHPGRLTGLDPAAAMLVQARRGTPDIEWVLGDTRSGRWKREFALAVMTGHAFQQLVRDEDIRQCLDAVREALTEDGRFVFETRNPEARAWERWTPDRVHTITGPDGTEIRVSHEVTHGPANGVVGFTETYACDTWPAPAVGRNALRFLTTAELDRFLADAGLHVLARHGDWDRSPLTPASPEIITVAVAAS